MRAKMARGGRYINDQGRRYILREMKYNGRIVWPNWSLALSTDQLRFTAAGGSSTLYVVAAGVNAIGTPVQRIPLAAEDLIIEKYGDPDGRITRDGLVFGADNLGTTPYDAVSGIYRITWPEKNLTIDLPFSQGENKIEQTIPAHDITTGVGALEFYNQDRERVDVIPMTGGIFDVTCVRSYTHVDAEYIWSSGAHQGGDSHIGQAKIVSPQSLSFPAGSPQPLEYHSSDITFGSNAHSRDEIEYRVIATFDNISSSERRIYQEADRYTEVVVPVEDSYFAHIDINNSGNLTAAGGSCELIRVEAGHYARTEYRWESGGSTFSDSYLVDDPFSLGVAGLVGKERYHIGAYDPEFIGYHVTHDNMGTNPKDQVYFTCTNLSDTDTVARTPYDTYITINNRRTKNWDTHTETTGLSTPSFSPAVVPVLGGEVEVSCLRIFSYYEEKYTWDSGVVEGGAEIHGLMESISPTSLTVTPVSPAPNPTYVGAHSIIFGSNEHNTDDLIYNVKVHYDGKSSSAQRLDQLGDSYTAVEVPVAGSYEAYITVFGSGGLTAKGGSCTLQANASHYEETEYHWKSGGITTGNRHSVADGYEISKAGDSERFHVSGLNVTHDNMQARGTDWIQFIVTNTSDRTITASTSVITITNAATSKQNTVFTLTTPHVGDVPASGDSSIRFNYASYYETWKEYESGYETTHEQQQHTADLTTTVGTIRPTTTEGLTGYAYLNVPQNPNPTRRSIVVTMRYIDRSQTVTLYQEAQSHPIDYYIEVTESTLSGYRDITIKNNYTSTLSGYVRCDIYDEYGTYVTYTEISFNLASGATKAATRIPYGYGYYVDYTKHVF